MLANATDSGTQAQAPSAPRATRNLLAKIARESGGRSFFLEDVEELGSVYGTIECELRSRYLLAYQSSNTGDGFREVEVRVASTL